MFLVLFLYTYKLYFINFQNSDMKKVILFAAVILIALSTVKAEKSWPYKNLIHKKSSITVNYTYQSGSCWIEENNIEGPFNYEECQFSNTDVLLFDKVWIVYVKLTPTEIYASWNETGNLEKYYDESCQ